jgi:hypothetical protein
MEVVEGKLSSVPLFAYCFFFPLYDVSRGAEEAEL